MELDTTLSLVKCWLEMCPKHPNKVKRRVRDFPKGNSGEKTHCLFARDFPSDTEPLIEISLPAISHSPILSRHQTIPNQVLRYVKCSNNIKLLSSTHEMTPNQLPIPEHINMAGILLKFNHCESGMVI